VPSVPAAPTPGPGAAAIPPPPAEPQTPSPPPPLVLTLAVTRLLAFGDSMTEGVSSAPVPSILAFVDVPQSYPYKLRAQLAAVYATQSFTVLNAGLAGERAEQAPPRFIDALREAGPQVVLLMDGSNDLLLGGRRGIPRAIGGIETMIKEATRRGAQVFLATLPPERAGSPRGTAAPYVAEFNAELVKTALDEGATIVDVGAAVDLSFIGVDGLHPTEQGYDRIAATFRETLTGAFERKGEPAASPAVAH
jgi:lysophospholipase L1-like esterase